MDLFLNSQKQVRFWQTLIILKTILNYISAFLCAPARVELESFPQFRFLHWGSTIIPAVAKGRMSF
jgi:hypothetical protein